MKVADALSRLAELGLLAEDWDGHGALSPAPLAIARARQYVMDPGVYGPPPPGEFDILPCTDGAVLFEWHRDGVDGEIEFHPDGLFTFWQASAAWDVSNSPQ